MAAALQALFVTFLWSTSWVLIKIGLHDIPALIFAGLRYSLAFLCLLPFALRPAHLAPLRGLSRGGWARLVVLDADVEGLAEWDCPTLVGLSLDTPPGRSIICLPRTRAAVTYT